METPPSSHPKHHSELLASSYQTGKTTDPSPRNRENIQNFAWAPPETRKSPYPIWRLVEGACVMTELDWGDGMACWITTLVSWLGIRVLPSWWAPGPVMVPPTALCMEIFCPEKTQEKDQKEPMLQLLPSPPRPKLQIWSCHLNRVMASGKV